jgi:hypothetical protein
MLFALATATGGAVDPSWLAGYWLSCDNSREVSETWSDMRAGALFGTGITFDGGKVSWEQMRIAPTPNGYAFFAQPSGQPSAEFPLVRHSPNELVFENPKHDFPQRVIYRRAGNQLIGRIEGVANGKPRSAEWRYRAAPLNTRCWGKPAAAPNPRNRRDVPSL